MEKIELGILLKVHDLDGCRWFYREVLGLGEPVMDSTFAVEFAGSPRLRLEKSTAPYVASAASPMLLTLDGEVSPALFQRIEQAGIELEEVIRPGGRFLRCADPDGNVVLISALSETETKD